MRKNDPIFLDTNCFSDKSFINRLSGYFGRKMISSITYAELQYHFVINRRKKESALRASLNRNGIKIEPLRSNEIDQSIKFIASCNEHHPWNDHHMDYLISGHIFCQPTKLITQNVRDFYFLEENVIDMYDFQRDYL